MSTDPAGSGGVKRARPGRLWAVMRKDITLFARDRLFIFLTILSVAAFVTLYWVLPREVDETIAVGIHGGWTVPEEGPAEEGLTVKWYDTAEELSQAVADRNLDVGIDFPEGFVRDAAAGKKAAVTVFVRPGLPKEVGRAMETMVREIAFSLAGHELPVTEPEEDLAVLGKDMAGNQIPLREKLRPLYAFMVLIMEAVALGTLIASEIQQRTITAVLATSTRISHVLGAKLLIGTFIAFSEGAVVMLLIRGFGVSPGIVLTSLLFGALLVSGIAMIAGSAGKSLVGTMLISILFLIPLAVPAFALLFPGSPGWWMELIPSYGLVKAISVATIDGEGWAGAIRYLGVLLGWSAAIVFTGALVLKRRVEAL